MVDGQAPTLTSFAVSFSVLSQDMEIKGVIYINSAPIESLR